MSIFKDNNEVIDLNEGFYVSYNPNPCSKISMAIPSFASNDGSDETALVNKKTGHFLVLNGDFRHILLKAKDVKDVVDLFNKKHDSHRSLFSDGEMKLMDENLELANRDLK